MSENSVSARLLLMLHGCFIVEDYSNFYIAKILVTDGESILLFIIVKSLENPNKFGS